MYSESCNDCWLIAQAINWRKGECCGGRYCVGVAVLRLGTLRMSLHLSFGTNLVFKMSLPYLSEPTANIVTDSDHALPLPA